MGKRWCKGAPQHACCARRPKARARAAIVPRFATQGSAAATRHHADRPALLRGPRCRPPRRGELAAPKPCPNCCPWPPRGLVSRDGRAVASAARRRPPYPRPLTRCPLRVPAGQAAPRPACGPPGRPRRRGESEYRLSMLGPPNPPIASSDASARSPDCRTRARCCPMCAASSPSSWALTLTRCAAAAAATPGALLLLLSLPAKMGTGSLEQGAMAAGAQPACAAAYPATAAGDPRRSVRPPSRRWRTPAAAPVGSLGRGKP